MSRIFNILRSTGFLLVLTLIFYFAGMFCAKTPDIESLKQSGIATQEEYTYLDSEGEEHEGETLVEITGIGKILTYSDVYFAPIPLFLLAMLIGAFVFK